MRSIDLTVDERLFNLLWRSLSCRETEMLAQIEREGEESDEAALLANEVVYLRMCKKDLEDRARQARFSQGVFSLAEGFIDLSKM
jgi:hypothetical protein